MKKFLAVLFFISTVWTVLPAQYGFRVGFQASPVFSWLNSDDRYINSNGQNLGIRLGTKVDYFFAEKYALTTGLSLSFNQGGLLLHDYGGDLLGKTDLPEIYRDLPDGTNIRYNINYVDVPIGLHLLTNEIFRDVRFFFEVPVFNIGILYGAKADITGPGLEPLEGENISKDVVPVNVSWGLGGGIEYNLRGNSSGDTNLFAGVFSYPVFRHHVLIN
ncbi:MAG: PorT family protein [Saprospirales bacterium]|nr:PorT family protein [Saprospirales bacterium]